MRISAKGRYALVAIVSMAQLHESGKRITLISISEKLGISKIYLEQVFSLLKKAELVVSTKGALGGYQLARMPKQITVLDVLRAVEVPLFEETQDTVGDKAPEIDKTLRLSAFNVLDQNVQETLCAITIEQLVGDLEKHKENCALLLYS